MKKKSIMDVRIVIKSNPNSLNRGKMPKEILKMAEKLLGWKID